MLTPILYVCFFVYLYLFSILRPCSYLPVVGRERVKQRLILYHGVMPIYMQFSNDAEETFSRALNLLLVRENSLCIIIFAEGQLCLLLHINSYFAFFVYLVEQGPSEGRTICDSCPKWSTTHLASRIYPPHSSSQTPNLIHLFIVSYIDPFMTLLYFYNYEKLEAFSIFIS